MTEFIPSKLNAEIVEQSGCVATVRLEGGRMIQARFARRLGCLFGSFVGKKVVVQLRKNPDRPGLIVQIHR